MTSIRKIIPKLIIAVIGANGQLGSEFPKMLGERHTVVPLSRVDIQVEKIDSVSKTLGRVEPEVVINTAAFHNFFECEKNPEMATLVNERGAYNVSKVALKVGARVIYVSTDYVYDGTISYGEGYSERDTPNPQSVYGKSKLGGELATLGSSSANSVMRIASLFGLAGSSGKGGNFLESVITKKTAGEGLRVVGDNEMSPTYAKDAALFAERIMCSGRSGIFHSANAGSASWRDLAEYALAQLFTEFSIESICGSYEHDSMRPKVSTLFSTRAKEIGHENRSWQLAVDAYLMEKGYL